MSLLRRMRELVQRDSDQCRTCDVHQDPMRFIPARKAHEAFTTGQTRLGGYKYRTDRVVDPLADANQQHAEREEQGMRVGDAVQVDGGSTGNARCPECGDELIPVVELEPGLRIEHGGTSGVGMDGVATSIVAPGRAGVHMGDGQ